MSSTYIINEADFSFYSLISNLNDNTLLRKDGLGFKEAFITNVRNEDRRKYSDRRLNNRDFKTRKRF